MAKKSKIASAGRTPKFKVRGYNRCPLCGRPKAFLRKFQVLSKPAGKAQGESYA